MRFILGFLKRHPALIVSTMVLTALTTIAQAADAPAKGPSEAVFVAELVLLLLVGRLCGEIMQRLKQPAVIGQLIAGIILGPSIFGAALPGLHDWIFPPDHTQKAMIDGVGQVGILMLLLLTGMETDVALVRRAGKAAFSVSITGIAVPFCCGVAFGLFVLPDGMLPSPDHRTVTALFLGTALSISSIKIVAMVVREMNFMRRNLGQVIVASAIVDDTIGWIIVAITFGIAKPGGLDLRSLAFTIGGTMLFLVVSYAYGRRIVSLVIRAANDHLASEFPVITAILVVMGLMALLTDAIGVHTVLGAFVAGVLIGESPILTRHIEEQLRGLIVALFMPVFFTLAGLGTDIGILKDPHLLAATGGLILIASVGKFAGAFLGGKLGGLTRQECLALALAMNARGSTEVIVATIGLSLGALDGHLFTMIVTMAVVTTLVMPPTLRWALARLPLSAEEAERLEREAFDARDFVAGLERLLLAADGSPSGHLAARLTGILGGLRGLPTTVASLGDAETGSNDAAGYVRVAAETARVNEGITEAGGPPDVITRDLPAREGTAGLAREAAKGYDLTMIGLEPVEAPDGGLSPRIADALGRIEGARAIVMSRGALRSSPLTGPLRILVPVNGSEASRRAAELAMALARADNATVTMLHVSPPGVAVGQDGGRRLQRAFAARKLESDIFSGLQASATQNGLRVRTRVRVSEVPEEAILRQARRTSHTLIVIALSPRQGDGAMLGRTAEALLERADQSVIFLAV